MPLRDSHNANASVKDAKLWQANRFRRKLANKNRTCVPIAVAVVVVAADRSHRGRCCYCCCYCFGFAIRFTVRMLLLSLLLLLAYFTVRPACMYSVASDSYGATEAWSTTCLRMESKSNSFSITNEPDTQNRLRYFRMHAIMRPELDGSLDAISM